MNQLAHFRRRVYSKRKSTTTHHRWVGCSPLRGSGRFPLESQNFPPKPVTLFATGHRPVENSADFRKTIYLGLIILLFAFILTACAAGEKARKDISGEKEATLPPTTAANETIPSPGLVPSTTPSTPCTAGWTCLSSTKKIYRYENCSFGERMECKLGCFNDNCRKPSTCLSGFKCNGQYSKGFQAEDCSWVNEVKCEWGCEKAECLSKPNETSTATGTATTTETTATTKTNVRILVAGTTETIAVGGTQYSLRIYNLKETQVQLELDTFRSSWIEEGKSYTFSNGITIKVFAILYRGTASSRPSEIEYVVE